MRTGVVARPLVLAIMAGGLMALVGPASPASAQVTFTTAPRLSWVYTDSRAKDTTFTVGETNVPVGAWRDANNKVHRSRTYATFDISSYAGRHITQANIFLRDDTTTNCALRSLQLWETAIPRRPPTWHRPPAQRTLLGTLGPTPCPGLAGFDVTDRVRDAVASGRSKIAIALQVPVAVEGDPAYGRSLSWFSGVQLSVGSNAAPTVDENFLYNNQFACDTTAPYTLIGPQVALGALIREPDENGRGFLAMEFAIWPALQPDQRTVINRTNASADFVQNVTVPTGVLADGVTYAWQVRVTDGTDTSAWSRTCSFTVDATFPAAAPVITSNYPEGEVSPGGIPATFTFAPNGVADVAAYQFSLQELGGFGSFARGPNGEPIWNDPFDRPDFVRAGADGSATVTIPLTGQSFVRLSVRGVDHAYLPGPTRVYQFLVEDTSPTVSFDESTVASRQPFPVTFTKHPTLADVVEYTYRVDDGPTQTVPADANGSATVVVTVTGYGTHGVWARSRSSNGWISPEGSRGVYVDNIPNVTSETYPEDSTGGGVGVEGTFTFHPGPYGAASYVYSFNFVEDLTVSAGADGTATVSFTPDQAGSYLLVVRAVDAHGDASGDRFYFFDVAGSG